jgi:hypothetical protein
MKAVSRAATDPQLRDLWYDLGLQGSSWRSLRPSYSQLSDEILYWLSPWITRDELIVNDAPLQRPWSLMTKHGAPDGSFSSRSNGVSSVHLMGVRRSWQLLGRKNTCR